MQDFTPLTSLDEMQIAADLCEKYKFLSPKLLSAWAKAGEIRSFVGAHQNVTYCVPDVIKKIDKEAQCQNGCLNTEDNGSDKSRDEMASTDTGMTQSDEGRVGAVLDQRFLKKQKTNSSQPFTVVTGQQKTLGAST